MAKLYWRVKKQGKWTWQPAKVVTIHLNEEPDGRVWESYEVGECNE